MKLSLQKAVELLSLSRRLPFAHRNIPDTHFC
jgi:hypothetical protein